MRQQLSQISRAEIKIIKQPFMDSHGLRYSYAVWIRGYPRFQSYNKEEFEAYMRGLGIE